ncbi:hypothetical protein ACFL5L_02365 [candidate division KSB1 bacterium]
MDNDTGQIQTLIKDGIIHLGEIHRLTNCVSEAVGSDNYEGIEALFISRGEEIKKLTDVEQKISKTISKTPSKTAEPLIKDYITTRNKLFEDILDQNKNLDRDLRAVRETVLTEIKSLNRGKKMHQRYVDASTLNSGFIDVKE